jgi:NAD(P)-dependent dehydrogenase (short-subunit alcohol dehydrogenase family)
VVIDLTSPEGTQAVVDAVINRGNRSDGCKDERGLGLHILINAAGAVTRTDIKSTTTEELDRLWAINVRAVTDLTQTLLPYLTAGDGASIINLGSLGSVIGLDQRTMYATTKGAIAQYTVSLASEIASFDIRANVVAPGYIETPMTTNWLWDDADRTRLLLDRIPMRRFGSTDDIGGVFVFLASSASAYMTGQIVMIDGGWTCH